ncbi:GNAT family N-acetyltransferase [Aquihabitans sp. G128]|uniref:GNAT family N-acetyltransferase n=1 Tax=Aquihabitans sp. G128 TaxID=2849779 RepID=UPI001C215DD5|nr:GNAT family N-acetyltransferase [Aquihabitans sp. G128]QXC59230.1 GNAT family N-acetyltransferase [Aquihabitans sp. G128]
MAAVRVPIGAGTWLRLGRHPELEQVAADFEPWTIAVSGALRERRRPGSTLVACIEDRSGALLGALVVERVAANRWNALPMVLDARSAPVLAWLADRSPARRVFGMPDHVDPLLAGLSRLNGTTRLPFFANRLAGVDRPQVDPRTRVAGPGDVPAILDVLQTYPYLSLPSRRAKRRFVERTIAERFAVVVEVDGRVVGAVLLDALGRDHAYLADMAVHPDFRGQGLAWPMIVRLGDLALELDIGLCASKDDTNPMNVSPHVAIHGAGPGEPVDEWVAAQLRPRRVLGPAKWRDHQVRRAHRLVDALEQRGPRLRRPAPTLRRP